MRRRALARGLGQRTQPAVPAQAIFNHRHSSPIVGRLPYERMPTRKIFAVTQKNTQIVAMETAIEIRRCTIGGSETSARTNIVSGPKTGEREKPMARPESGLVMIANIRNHGSIISIEIGAISCCASFSELQTAPAIA